MLRQGRPTNSMGVSGSIFWRSTLNRVNIISLVLFISQRNGGFGNTVLGLVASFACLSMMPEVFCAEGLLRWMLGTEWEHLHRPCQA